MKKKYCIRLDDACPTMNKKKWDTIEHILNTYQIKPIVAVIPNNKNKEYYIDSPLSYFWETIYLWQQKGWHIALHGYDHVYHHGQKKPLISLNNNSEFAGLSFQEQYDKINKGLAIFQTHSIKTNIWVAPSHTFDSKTLQALQKNGTISIISDGLAIQPFNSSGFFWIPQQQWNFKQRKFGIWTICLHPNTLSQKKIQALEIFCQRHANECIDNIEDLRQMYMSRKKSIIDSLYEFQFLFKMKYKRYFSDINRRKLPTDISG